MTRPTLLQWLPLILSLFYIAPGATSVSNQDFIAEVCAITRYPEVCVRSLTGHANAIGQSFHRLARTGLIVGLTSAESTKSNMLRLTNIKGLKPNEVGALKDCLDQVDDTVDRLSQSVRKIELLGQARGQESKWHEENVVTWSSAALSQMDTCAQGFSDRALDGKLKASVQGQVTNVEQIVSNAIELFHLFADRMPSIAEDV